MERRIERSLIHAQDVARELLDSLGDRPPVTRLRRKGAENEEVERALK
jgi:hypothetical protein